VDEDEVFELLSDSVLSEFGVGCAVVRIRALAYAVALTRIFFESMEWFI
jgi:hypothetical protein